MKPNHNWQYCYKLLELIIAFKRCSEEGCILGPKLYITSAINTWPMLWHYLAHFDPKKVYFSNLPKTKTNIKIYLSFYSTWDIHITLSRSKSFHCELIWTLLTMHTAEVSRCIWQNSKNNYLSFFQQSYAAV